MSSHRIRIAAPVRVLAALMTLGIMTSCHSGGGGGCLTENCVSVYLQGTLSGLVGTGLVLMNGSEYSSGFSGPASNGTQVNFGGAFFNSTYALTIQSQPTNPAQTCVITNGSGTAGNADVTNIAVTCTTNPPRFVYVVNRGSNDISAYSINPATGTLAVIAGSPFAAGKLPVAAAVDQTGHFAYVVNQTDATLSAFSIDRNSGALTEINGSPYATGLSPTSVAVDPSSSFVYVANGGAASVSAYAITAASGALTAVAGSPIAVGNSPSSVAVDPLGAVFVTNKTDGTFSVFYMESGGPNFASGSPFATGLSPQATVTNVLAQFVYVANSGSNSLSSLAGVGSGTVIEIADSPYPTGSTPYSVAMDPLGRFIYVADQGSNTITGFQILSGGALAALPASPFSAGLEPSSVAVDPTGSFAYVVNTGSDNVSVYALDGASGALSSIGSSPFVTGKEPASIAISD